MSDNGDMSGPRPFHLAAGQRKMLETTGKVRSRCAWCFREKVVNPQVECVHPRQCMDRLSAMQRGERMALVRSVDTGQELLIRRLVHSMGFRYRLHVRDLPGKPDMVFPASVV